MNRFWSATRRSILTGMVLLLVLVVQSGCGWVVATHAPESRNRIKILHVNDVHSHLQADSIDLEIDGVNTRCEVGGMARVAAMISQLSTGDDGTLVLHAGDAVQGTLYYTLFRGQADAAAMNAIGFDAVAIGNHEFDDGDAWLAGFISVLDAPVISANIEVARGNVLEGRFAPFVIKRIGGVDVGIVGVTIAGKTRDSSQPSDQITFHDEVASVAAVVDELLDAGIGRIVVLSHYGYRNALRLAAEVPGIDVIVDGDSHTLLGDFDDYGLKTPGPYPTMAKNADGDPVCIVQAWEYGKVVGELDVVFRGNVIEHCTGTPHLILGETIVRRDKAVGADTRDRGAHMALQAAIDTDPKLDRVADDPVVGAVIAGYADKIDTISKTVIGHVAADLLHNRVPGHVDGGVVLDRGSDVAPLVAKAFYEQDPNADISIQNAGGVRISLPAGDLTYEMVYKLLPFSNTLFEIKMSGAEVKQVLEDAIENIARGGSDGSFPYCYALKYDVDATQAYGRRVRNLEFKDRKTGSYSVLQGEAQYVVVTNDYIAAGKDGYDTFAAVQTARGPGTQTYLDYAMSFVNHVQGLTEAGQSLTKLPSLDHCIKSYLPTPRTDDDL